MPFCPLVRTSSSSPLLIVTGPRRASPPPPHSAHCEDLFIPSSSSLAHSSTAPHPQGTTSSTRKPSLAPTLGYLLQPGPHLLGFWALPASSGCSHVGPSASGVPSEPNSISAFPSSPSPLTRTTGTQDSAQTCRLGLEEARIRDGLGPWKGVTHGNAFGTSEAEPESQKFQNTSLQWQPDHLQAGQGTRQGWARSEKHSGGT